MSEKQPQRVIIVGGAGMGISAAQAILLAERHAPTILPDIHVPVLVGDVSELLHLSRFPLNDHVEPKFHDLPRLHALPKPKFGKGAQGKFVGNRKERRRGRKR